VSERKEMSTEMRSLLAAVLCLAVIAIWSLIYKPATSCAAGQSRAYSDELSRAGANDRFYPHSGDRKKRGPRAARGDARSERGKFHRR
jgi:hypothetical protein